MEEVPVRHHYGAIYCAVQLATCIRCVTTPRVALSIDVLILLPESESICRRECWKRSLRDTLFRRTKQQLTYSESQLH
eukprot:scaffold8108_cov118-Skeletonema_dohrnii-CCMP3373.AAC.1